MAYRIKNGDGGVQEALRRIAGEQLGRALDELEDDSLDLAERVHQVRKRCKKVRGLLRLVRKSFDDYSDENEALRDAARRLSPVRDAQTLIETYDAVMAQFGEAVDRREFAAIRARLTRDAKAVHDAPDTAQRIVAFREDLRGVRTRAAGWTLDDGGYEAIGGGLAKTYARARAALAEAWADPTPENMHEWRKRVKYHWYHARILVTVNHPMIGPQAEGADRLADLLGDHHDLAVFDERLTSEPGDFGPNTDLDGFRALMLRRRTELEAAAFADGRRLLAEDADALVDRWGAYWSVWTKGGGRPGELVL